MINYNTKEWFSLIFKFHKSDTFRILLPSMILLGALTGLCTYVVNDVYQITIKSTLQLHSLMGFVISLLLVFRTNTAYDRWWEGRKQWGALLNSCRNFSLKVEAYMGAFPEITKECGALLHNYTIALKEHLRDKKVPVIAPTNLHQPNFIAGKLIAKLTEAYKAGYISGDQLITLNAEFQSLTDICGACERIKKTPIPYSYSLFLKKFIFLYIITMPFGLVSDFGYYSILIVILVFYVLASLELIAEEIEEPFGLDSNDLPTDQISENVGISISEIIRQKN